MNLTRLTPGTQSALHHRHSCQDEFIYVIEGEPTLRPGMCAGFPAGGAAHHLVNRSRRHVVYLEIGDRAKGDEVSYPDDDLQAVLGEGGRRRFARKDGRPY